MTVSLLRVYPEALDNHHVIAQCRTSSDGTTFSIFVLDEKFPDQYRAYNEILKSQFPGNYYKTTQLL